LNAIEDGIAARVALAVRERRERLGLTLRALADRSGVSPSMISDIERRAKSPTISTLAALATALGVPVTALVDEAAPGTGLMHVERAAVRPSVTDPGNGATRDRIGPVYASGSGIEIVRLILPPRCVAGPFPAHPSGTLEHIHLAQGHLRVTLGSEAVTLEAGDSCTCRAGEPHSFDNSAGDASALIYIVIEPPAASDSGVRRAAPLRARTDGNL
jgi:transcriptional regulator with XRE-family HTH domain